MPFLKEEKSEHECARQYEIAIQLVCARHCELPLSKMGNKSLFPVVAVPRAFFGTFFRFERKYYPLRGGSPTVRAVVGASFPHWRKGDCACGRTKGLFFPPLETFGYRSCRETHRGKIPIRAAAGPSSHRQPKTTRQENSLSRRVTMIFQKINPSLHPPSRRTQCASDTPDRKSRWAGSPASAWPSSRPYPPSRSRLSGTARQWGWSCTS